MARCFNITFFVFWGIKALESLVMFGHGDALNYHLVGPKIALEEGHILAMHEQLLGYLQAGFFDLVYFIPVSLFGASLPAQLMSQFIHFFFSIGLGSILIYKLVKHPLYSPLAAISLLTISVSADFFLYAKNDGALALISLITTVLLFYLHQKKSPLILQEAILMGICLGLIPSVKMNGLLVLIPISITFSYLFRKKPKMVFVTAISAVITLCPLLFRNYYYTGNPFFPGLVSIIPGKLSAAIQSHYTFFNEAKLTFPLFLKHVKTFFMGKAIFMGVPLLVFFNWKYKISKANLFLLISVLTFALFMILDGGVYIPRYYFPCFFLMIPFIFLSLRSYHLSLNNKWCYWLLFVLILVDSKVDKSLSRITHMYQDYLNLPARVVVNKVSPYTTMWNYVHSSDQDHTYILTDAWAQNFYSPRGFRIIQYRGTWEGDFLGICQESDLEKLNKYQYAILSLNLTNPCYTKIVTQGTFLHQVAGYKLYDLRGLHVD